MFTFENEDMMAVWHVNPPWQLRKSRRPAQIRQIATTGQKPSFKESGVFSYHSGTARYTSPISFSPETHTPQFTQHSSGSFVLKLGWDNPFPGRLPSSLPRELSRERSDCPHPGFPGWWGSMTIIWATGKVLDWDSLNLFCQLYDIHNL